MSIPKETKQFLDQIASFPPMHLMTPEEIRKAAVATAITGDIPISAVEDVVLQGPHGELTVRLYRPSGDSDLPVILFFHGGGFVFNRMNDYDPMCHKMAASTGRVIVSVDYRLAPEYKFPVPVDEAIYAAEWLSSHAKQYGLDAERIAVAGESVGATLAAVVAQQARTKNSIAVQYQVLLCPLTDWKGDNDSKKKYGDGYFLTTALLDYCALHYLNSPDDQENPLASPMYGDVKDVVPALIITAELDPLRDEGEKYGQMLIENGVRVTMRRYHGMIHLFYAMTDVFNDGNDVYDVIRDQLSTC
ncbi:alpha/beta hydrolase [Oceanobacillus neutriphilus]|uniref:Alpha/beta hydrolase n=1 Tax=Oceanobacillus neutriphilus TaxID=531815 RepID=A0ABQ2NX41_9BACI|nr:alpha/beta hydrolase [Oceanobacillus neutriphilus]GGP12622.1 alpha/beta hydrolase [Oceanobacillus neutriphilus]